MRRKFSKINIVNDTNHTAPQAPLLSVIMPVYNVEQYIRQSIDSVVGQTLGFLDNIQLILVNDGSSDGTADICREYSEMYPTNVVFIDQKNQGVSTARNNGLKKASGKYVNFFDGDDIWSKDSFERAVNFLEEHEDTVDFVAFKIKFFDKIIDSHPSNYKFNKTRVIDLNKEPDNPIFHLPTCVFKRSPLSGKLFDKRLKISEDVKFLNEVLVDKKAYGVSAKGTYNYRKRPNESSAIGGQQSSRDYYLVVPELAYKYMLNLWRDKKGRVHKFMQYEILSDLSWRLPQKSQDVLTKKEETYYKSLIKDIVKELDDDTILSKTGLDLIQKIFLLKMKHGSRYYQLIKVDKDKYYFDSHYLCKLDEDRSLIIEFINQNRDGLYEIEGYITQVSINQDDKYILQVDDKRYDLTRTERIQRAGSFLGDVTYDGGGVVAAIELDESVRQVISAKLISGDCEVDIPIGVKGFSGLSQIPTSYHCHKRLLMRRENGRIKTYPYSTLRLLQFEIKHCSRILLNWKLREAISLWRVVSSRNLTFLPVKMRLFEALKPFLLSAESIATIPEALLLRALYFINKAHLNKPVWLISDRGMAAGDNGEALFKYIMSQKDVEAEVYYVISKKSADYERLKRYGKLLNQNSLKYKLKFLLASKVISSQADVEVTNPFLRQLNRYVDLFNFDFVFLQHGIIHNDLSRWLNKYHKNINLFITSAKREYDSIFNHPYYYNKSEVALTGLPRYDYLDSKPQRKLMIAPTYRKSLARMKTDKNGARRYDPCFKESAYYKFYNNLIHDERIIEALSAHNMTGEFYLHPAFSAQFSDFQSNTKIQVMNYPYNYRRMFNEGSLLVTDFSSIIFDFAYLKKPVIYSQFDADEFYGQHAYDKGEFFSDEDDGFGSVIYDYESLVNEIISTIEGGCVMSDKYIKRVESFFFKTDKNNSKRVYQAIKRLPDRGFDV